MKELYYYPDLSEFHEGLRCEIRNPWARTEEEKQWEPYIFTFNTYDDMPHEYDEGYEVYRVKYLDRQDIEDLGWVKVLSAKDHESYDRKGFKLVTSDKGVHIFKTNGNVGGDFRLFFGQIRNWNELKTLMNQIGIL